MKKLETKSCEEIMSTAYKPLAYCVDGLLTQKNCSVMVCCSVSEEVTVVEFWSLNISPRVTVVTVEFYGWRSWILPAPEILRMSILRCFSAVAAAKRVTVTPKRVTVELIWVTVTLKWVTVTLLKPLHSPSAFLSDLCPQIDRRTGYRESAQNGTQANVGHLWAHYARNENAWMIQKNVGLREGSLLRASIAFGSPHSGPPNATGRGVPRTPYKKRRVMP